MSPLLQLVGAFRNLETVLKPDTAHSQGYVNQPGLATGPQANSWREVVDAVHEAGGAIIAQSMHAGGRSHGNSHRPDTVGPSAAASRGEQFGLYRGSGKFRTPRALTVDVLQAVGSDIAVGVRISQTKVSDPAHRWVGQSEDAETVFGSFGRTGLRYVHTTEPRATEPAFGDSAATLAEHAKRHSGKKIMANGGLATPQSARSLVAAGIADVVTLGRPALADRDRRHATREGREVGELPLAEVLTPFADIKDVELR